MGGDSILHQSAGELIGAVDHKSKGSLILLLLLQLVFCATVFFDIPVFRQVIGFFYLTFVPGYILLKLLRLGNLNALQTVLFSSGLSIALLMILGLIANGLGVLAVFSNALSSLTLMIVLNIFIVGEFIIYWKNRAPKLLDPDTFRTSGKTPLALLLLALPVSSVIGAIWENIFNSNIVLMFVVLTIAAVMALSIISKRFLPTEYYPIVIFSLALALLFHSALISNYVQGFDIQHEYNVFATTQNSGYWNQIAYSSNSIYAKFNGMLSVTVLPTFYSNVLYMDGTWVFKIIFPLIFSLVPLGLYELWHPNFGKKSAMVATFLFVSQLTFYTEMLALARQMIAELFFVLLFLLVCGRKLKNSAGAKICFFIFGFGLVVSHYSMSLIFLVFILFAWIFFRLTKNESFGLSSLHWLFFSIMMLVWYFFTSVSSVFMSILSVGSQLFSRFGDFFSPASRGSEVFQGLGLEAVQSNWVLLSRIFAYATEFFIVVGSILIIRRIWRAKFARSLSQTYFVFSLAAVIILVMCILIPTFASTLNMARFYHITLFFLAPLFVLGCEVLTGFLVKRRKQLVVSLFVTIIIVSYFLFQTGFVYEVVKSASWSIPLSGYRMDKTLLSYQGYIEEANVLGAQWIHKHADLHNIILYADYYSRDRELSSYGNIPNYYTNELTNTTVIPLDARALVYLSKLNVVYGRIARYDLANPSSWNSSELEINFSEMSKIYTDGECEIYSNPPSG